MSTIFPHAIALLSTPVSLSPTTAVIGYDRRLRQPVLDMGSGPVPLSLLERAAFDAGEEAFTDEQQRIISTAVEHLVANG